MTGKRYASICCFVISNDRNNMDAIIIGKLQTVCLMLECKKVRIIMTLKKGDQKSYGNYKGIFRLAINGKDFAPDHY